MLITLSVRWCRSLYDTYLYIDVVELSMFPGISQLLKAPTLFDGSVVVKPEQLTDKLDLILVILFL